MEIGLQRSGRDLILETWAVCVVCFFWKGS